MPTCNTRMYSQRQALYGDQTRRVAGRDPLKFLREAAFTFTFCRKVSAVTQYSATVTSDSAVYVKHYAERLTGMISFPPRKTQKS